MKQKIKYIIYTIVIISYFTNTTNSFGQWDNGPLFSTSFTQPDYANVPALWLPFESAGIGDFKTPGLAPRAAFHVNTNLLGPITPQGYATLGEVFLTTAGNRSQDISTFWRQERMTAGVATEYGMVYSLTSADDNSICPTPEANDGSNFYIQASGSHTGDDGSTVYGDFRLNTGPLAGGGNPFGITTPRMRVLGDNGFLGVGDYTTFTPQNLEHLHIQYTDGYGFPTNVYQQFTNSLTTPAFNHGFKIGIGYDGVTMNAEVRQQEVAPITFHTRTANGLNPMYERVRIDERAQQIPGGLTTQATGVTISRGPQLYGTTGAGNVFSNPIATFNIGTNTIYNNLNWAGNRPWMDVGTYNNFHSDNMYIGLKDEGLDGLPNSDREVDAVIDWGDNLDGVHTNDESIQNLRFIFTATGIPANTYVNGPHQSFHGLEVARMCSNGNMGIGDFYNGGPITNVIEPVAKLEILDARDITQNFPNLSLSRPHLRLTYTQAGSPSSANGIWADFRTTALGDLYIHPYGVVSSTNSTAIDRNVGINTSTPGNTLEINSGAGSVTPGASGLRFSWLTNASTTNSNASHKVLSVSSAGDVILVNDDGGNLSTCGSLPTNYINKATGASTICNSDIYETTGSGVGTTKVGIGVGSLLATTPNAKLDVYNDYPSTNTSIGIQTISVATGATPRHAFGLYASATGNQGYSKAIIAEAYPAIGGSGEVRAIEVVAHTSSAMNLGNYGIYSTVSGTGGATGYYSTVTGVSGAASTGEDITVGPGTYVTGMAVRANNGSTSNIGVGVTCAATGLAGVNGGFTADISGDATHAYGYACGVNNSNTSFQINEGYRAQVNGSSNSENYGADLNVASTSLNYGARIIVNSPTVGTGTERGIWNIVTNGLTNLGINTEVYTTSSSGASSTNTAVNAQAGSTTVTNLDNFGVIASTNGGSNINCAVSAFSGTPQTTLTGSNIGGNFKALGGSSFTYGVFVTSSTNCTTTGTVSTSNCAEAAGFFNGPVATTAFFSPSDSILKTNITTLTNGLGIINQLHPKTYNYDTAQYNFMNLQGDMQYGFIAQDLIPVLPQCLKTLGVPEELDSLGNSLHSELKYIGINQTMIIPILVAGMQEQQLQINNLQTQLDNCCGAPRPSNSNGNNTQQKTGAIKVELNNVSKVIQLFQNDPNPFHEQTTINFFIPDNVATAAIWFLDNNGTVLKKVTIEEHGEGSMIVMGSNLTSGTYSYSLFADGKIIETKRMIKVK